MKKLLDAADEYTAQSDWKDFALVKCCLCAVGVMIGLGVPKEKKKIPFFIAAAVFAATYIPLMVKFLKILFREECTDCEE